MGAVAVDASDVYFTAFDGHAGSIRRVPRNGGAVNTVLSCGSGCYPEALAVDPQNVTSARESPGPLRPMRMCRS